MPPSNWAFCAASAAPPAPPPGPGDGDVSTQIVCGKPADLATPPFCSKRCKDVDLHRWFAGVYSIPVKDDDDDDDGEDGDGQQDEQENGGERHADVRHSET